MKKLLSLILSLACMISIITPIYAADEIVTTVEDSVVTTTNEAFKFQYEGTGWTAEDGYPDIFHNGDDHYSDTVGDYFTFKFYGTKIEIYGSLNKNHGVYSVSVDDVAYDDITATITGATQHQQLLATIDGLSNSEHVLKVTNKGPKSIQIDYINVYHSDVYATKVDVAEDSIQLEVGGSKQLEYTLYPEYATKVGTVTYTSTGDAISVSDSGVVSANALGEGEVQVLLDGVVVDRVQVKVVEEVAKFSATLSNPALLELQEDYDALSLKSDLDLEEVVWRNDVVTSKIAVLTQENAVDDITVSVSDFTSADGVIGKENVEATWLRDVNARIGKGGTSSPTKAFPDVISFDNVKSLAANSVGFVWVEINVPKDAKPGVYEGTINLKAASAKTGIDVKYTIEVIDIAVPEECLTEMQIWQHPFSQAGYLGISEADYFGKEHFDYMRSSLEEYAAMGSRDLVANIVDEAWGHQSYFGDATMVAWTKKTDGTFTFDYTMFEQWINFADECGVLDLENHIGQIKCYSIVPWNNRITYYDEATQKEVTQNLTVGSAEWTTIWEQFLEDFMVYCEEKDIFDMVYIAMDERTLAMLRPTADLIESVTNEEGKSFKIFSAFNYDGAGDYSFTDRIHDVSIRLTNINHNNDVFRDFVDHRKELGLTTTIYTCTGDYPGNFIISDPGDNYWLIWYTMTQHADGYMKWAWDNWVADPHNAPNYTKWEPGDGWYIYPVEKENIGEVNFYSTPRYEMMKEGIRDVNKAKYLMSLDSTLKTMIEDIVAGLDRAEKGYSYSSATYANQSERMITINEGTRMRLSIDDLAQQYLENDGTIIYKGRLLAKLEEAKAITLTNYTANSAAALTSAIETAQQVYDASNTTQAQIDEQVTLLEAAMNNLVDKSVLLLKINEAKRYDLANYTAASGLVLTNAIKAAEEVYALENPTKAQMDEQIAALDAAISNLANPSTLLDAIEKAEAIDLTNYTEESAKVLTDAIAAARVVYQDENITKAQIDEQIKLLDDAQKALVKFDPSIYWPTLNENTLINTEANKDIVKAYDVSSYSADEADLSASLDYDLTTHWHSDYVNHNGEKHWGIFDLGQVYTLTDIKYLPRQTGTIGNGDFLEVEYYVSMDATIEDSEKVGTFIFDNDGKKLTSPTFQRAYLGADVKGQYVKFRVIHMGGREVDQYASMSEIRFYGYTGDTPPEASTDKTALQKAYDDAMKLNADDYTEESYAALTSALNDAKVILEKEDATQVEVDAAKAAIENAVSGLVKYIGNLINTEENKTKVTVKAVSSECNAEMEGEGLGTAQAALDYNTNTYWHSDYNNHNGEKHWVVYEFDKEYSFTDITFLPRQTGYTGNGDILEMEVYVSADETIEDSEKVGTFAFENDGRILVSRDYQHVEFESAVSGKYIKLIVTHCGGNQIDQYCSLAEIRFYGEGPKVEIKETEYGQDAFNITMTNEYLTQDPTDNVANVEKFIQQKSYEALFNNDKTDRGFEFVWDVETNYVNGALPEYITLPVTLHYSLKESDILNKVVVSNANKANGYVTGVKVEVTYEDETKEAKEITTMQSEYEFNFDSTNKVTNVDITILSAINSRDAEVKNMMTLSEIDLYKVVEEVVVDKAALEKAIDDGFAIDTTKYTEESVQALYTALNDGQVVFNKADATQEEVNAATKAITDAMGALVEKAPEVNKDALAKAIKDAEAIDQSLYTEESVAALNEAINAAKVVNNSATASQATVDAATKLVTDAMAALVTKPTTPTVDKEALKAAIEAAKKVDTTNKTDDSVAVLASAITAAEAIVAKEDATQAEVDAAKEALEAAVANLKDKPVMDFYDVQDKKAWFYGSVESAFTKGLMGATGKEPVNGKPFFEPDTPISRGMVATVLYRMAGQPKVEFKATFSDVTNVKLWYSTAITWASQAGVVSGYKDGRFGPDDNITRQDLAIMLRNYAKSCGLDTSVTVDFSAFKDGNKVVSYAQSAVQFCIDAKLMSGAKKADGVYLNPSDNATRAECAKMFSLLDDAIKANAK